MKTLVAVFFALSCTLIVGCAGTPYDNDPLLKPPQLIESDEEKDA